MSVGKNAEWDERRVNVNGGAIALKSHWRFRLSNSGFHWCAKWLNACDARKVRRRCIGGGRGVAATTNATDLRQPSFSCFSIPS
ncbi:hypothetical protein KCP70_06440 [Salmonella enterica subsp. enterica]|nr:hypothetical protein KCP70_06440 [Salmonella enterica subsp. enterica]